nr:PD-(D/E)XK nuclease family protein [Actinomycetota bacterium]
SLETFLEYIEAAQMDEDLEIAQPQHPNSVKLMTIHQAKGLEFDIVFVPGLSRQIFPDTKVTSNPYARKSELPYHIREDSDYLPSFESVMSRFREALKERAMEEERRLGYVALTRARKKLFLSCAHWYGEERSTSAGPGEFFAELAGKEPTEEDPGCPPHPAVTLRTNSPRPDENPLRDELELRAAGWPPSDKVEPDDLFTGGWRAALVEARRDPDSIEKQVAAAGIDRPEWDASRGEVAEQLALVTTPAPPAPIDERLKSLSVSNMVQLARCPKQFYWTVVRPLPRRPSRAARLGNDIHRWIEISSIGQQKLDDPEEPPDLAPEEVGDRPGRSLPTEESLKKAFMDSRFAEKRPRYIEQPFVISLEAGYLVRGRIDAVYVEGEEWELVDYKTGMQPAEDDEIAKLQLAIYALAAERIWGLDPSKIKVTYFYLKSGNTVTTAAEDLTFTEKDLLAMFEQVEARIFDPVPTQICGSCDFLRFCDAGRAFVAAQSSEPQ